MAFLFVLSWAAKAEEGTEYYFRRDCNDSISYLILLISFGTIALRYQVSHKT